MTTDLSRAAALLGQTVTGAPVTLALVRGEETETDTARGLRPLLARLDGGRHYAGYAAADLVVGRAAAFLYLLLGVREIYAAVMSTPARALLTAHGVAVEAGVMTDGIINRAGNGPCPMEAATADAETPEAALAAIRAALAAMRERQ